MASSEISSTATQIQYMPLIIRALRAMDGSGKASAVKEWIANTLTTNGQPIPDVTLASGTSKFANDIQWARLYLVNAGILETKETAGRGFWKLTPDGWETALDQVSMQALYERSTQRGRPSSDQPDSGSESWSQQPLIETWEATLANLLKTMPDKGFERLCAYIMTLNDMEAKVTGQSRDGGIDGEGLYPIDKYGLVKMRIAWQCKRYGEGNNVGSKEIRDFRGAIDGRAQYGLFFTTSGFTVDATLEASRPGATPIELIDLTGLMRLMRANAIGFSTTASNQSAQLDTAFFDEYMNPKGRSVSSEQGTLV